jgi:branched-chain amino acid transport system substrate-binding protein
MNTKMRKFTLASLLAGVSAIVALTAALTVASAAKAQEPIRVGVPMILSGAGAQFGTSVLKGAQMYADEINAKGGVLGRKFQIISRDTKSRPDEAVRVSRELVLRERVHFLVGTFTSAEGTAVSSIAKDLKVLFIAPVPATDRLTAPENLHPYVFRVAKNTTTEGRAAAEIMAKWPGIKRVATIAPDFAYGQDAAAAFVAHIKKLRPEVEIVDQQWPKLNEPDFSAFITAQMAAKPDAVLSVICCGNFDAFAKQAKPLGYFESLKHRFIGLGEAGAIEALRSLGKDYPVGIWGNTYDAFNWDGGGAAHKEWTGRLKKYLGEDIPSGWPIQGYIAMQFLAEAIKKAGDIDPLKVSAALKGMTIQSPQGPITIRAKDQQATRGMVWGQAVADPKYPFPVLNPVMFIDVAKFMD